MKKVFLSGGTHTDWQGQVIMAIHGIAEFFDPRTISHVKDAEAYTWRNLIEVRDSDIVFAYMEADNPSGLGLAVEVGYAVGLGKLVILVDDKSETDPQFERYFAIVRNAAHSVPPTLDEGIELLLTLVS